MNKICLLEYKTTLTERLFFFNIWHCKLNGIPTVKYIRIIWSWIQCFTADRDSPIISFAAEITRIINVFQYTEITHIINVFQQRLLLLLMVSSSHRYSHYQCFRAEWDYLYFQCFSANNTFFKMVSSSQRLLILSSPPPPQAEIIRIINGFKQIMITHIINVFLRLCECCWWFLPAHWEYTKIFT